MLIYFHLQQRQQQNKTNGAKKQDKHLCKDNQISSFVYLCFFLCQMIITAGNSDCTNKQIQKRKNGNNSTCPSKYCNICNKEWHMHNVLFHLFQIVKSCINYTISMIFTSTMHSIFYCCCFSIYTNHMLLLDIFKISYHWVI